MTTPPRGWYPDPSDPDKKIYWDGTAWAAAPAGSYPDLLAAPPAPPVPVPVPVLQAT